MADTRRRAEVLRYIDRERSLQEHRKQVGDFKHTLCDPEMTDEVRLACLMEEVGEVSTEICNRDEGDTEAMHKMFQELMQVGALAAAWMEYLLQQGVMTDG